MAVYAIYIKATGVIDRNQTVTYPSGLTYNPSTEAYVLNPSSYTASTHYVNYLVSPPQLTPYAASPAYTIYNTTTGAITGNVIASTAGARDAQVGAGESWIRGLYDGNTYYVNTSTHVATLRLDPVLQVEPEDDTFLALGDVDPDGWSNGKVPIYQGGVFVASEVTGGGDTIIDEIVIDGGTSSTVFPDDAEYDGGAAA